MTANWTSAKYRRLGAALAAAAAVGAGTALGVSSAVDSSSSPATPSVTVPAAQPAAVSSSKQLDPAQIYAQSVAGVVEIDVSGTAQSQFGPFGGQRETEGEGSGFVLDTKGDIVTNQHVVDGASSITVRFKDGTEAKGTVVGSDPTTDLAVVHVNVSASKLHPLPVGSSADVKPGEVVVAIGSPFGLADSITAGIVSATGRTIAAPDGSAIAGAIQTDAAINKGNSGGPLIDATGKVIGVNAQIDSSSGGSDGVGFAIPIDTVKQIADQIVAGGKAEHAFLGVQITTVTATASNRLGLPRGAEIVSIVSGSPAAKSGLRAGTSQTTVDGETYTKDGDVLVSVNGKTVTSASQLQSAIAAHKPGDSVTLGVSRGGKQRTVKVKLASRSQ